MYQQLHQLMYQQLHQLMYQQLHQLTYQQLHQLMYQQFRLVKLCTTQTPQETTTMMSRGLLHSEANQTPITQFHTTF